MVVGAPTKQCPGCQSIVLAALAQCPDCGHEWLRDLARHDAQASDAPILSVDDDLSPWITEHAVSGVTYHKHEKAGGGIPSLRVDYRCGLRTFREWICLEHGGPVRARAVDWWRARMPVDLAGYHAAIPRTVDGALLVVEHLRRPASVRVLERGKYPEILSHELEPDPKQESRDGGDAPARAGHRPGAAGEHALHGL
jgi:DNA repair protein RadD